MYVGMYVEVFDKEPRPWLFLFNWVTPSSSGLLSNVVMPYVLAMELPCVLNLTNVDAQIKHIFVRIEYFIQKQRNG